MRTIVEDFERQTAPRERTSRLLAATLGLMYAPSSTETAMHTIVAMMPRYRDHLFKETIRAIQKDMALTRDARIPAQMEIFVERIHQTPKRIRIFMLLQLVSASRHADLHNARISNVWELDGDWLAIRLFLPIWKSDQRGKLFAAKVIAWPKQLWDALVSTWKEKPTYKEVYNALQNVGTPHDLRRLALNTIEDPQEALILSCHATAIRETRAYRQYVAPSLNDAISQTQIKLSKHLWETFRTCRMMRN